jgi:hypothetical protein
MPAASPAAKRIWTAKVLFKMQNKLPISHVGQIANLSGWKNYQFPVWEKLPICPAGKIHGIFFKIRKTNSQRTITSRRFIF